MHLLSVQIYEEAQSYIHPYTYFRMNLLTIYFTGYNLKDWVYVFVSVFTFIFIESFIIMSSSIKWDQGNHKTKQKQITHWVSDLGAGAINCTIVHYIQKHTMKHI